MSADQLTGVDKDRARRRDNLLASAARHLRAAGADLRAASDLTAFKSDAAQLRRNAGELRDSAEQVDALRRSRPGTPFA